VAHIGLDRANEQRGIRWALPVPCVQGSQLLAISSYLIDERH
jgi:hypothetical protein